MKKLLVLLGAVFFVASCKSDKIQPIESDCPDVISFSSQIEPLIQQNCSVSGCHASGFVSPSLTSHSEISANADDILTRIQLDPTNSQLMPSGGPKLADSLIQQFNCWVSQGKLDN